MKSYIKAQYVTSLKIHLYTSKIYNRVKYHYPGEFWEQSYIEFQCMILFVEAQ